MISNNKFRKKNKLCSKKIIDLLYTKGISILSYPLKIVYVEHNLISLSKIQILFTVPKRNFKRANKRNLLKRRMREAYRLNSISFIESLINNTNNIAVSVSYIAKDIVLFSYIEKAIIKALEKVSNMQNDKNFKENN